MKTLKEYITEVRGLGEGWTTEWSPDKKYVAEILAFRNGSPYGIKSGKKEGKISKLCIRDAKTRKILVEYDRGWSVEPDGDVRGFYDDLIKKYN